MQTCMDLFMSKKSFIASGGQVPFSGDASQRMQGDVHKRSLTKQAKPAGLSVPECRRRMDEMKQLYQSGILHRKLERSRSRIVAVIWVYQQPFSITGSIKVSNIKHCILFYWRCNLSKGQHKTLQGTLLWENNQNIPKCFIPLPPQKFDICKVFFYYYYLLINNTSCFFFIHL